MFKFINETNGMYKRNYSFRMDIVEKVITVISCTENLANDIKNLYNYVLWLIKNYTVVKVHILED